MIINRQKCVHQHIYEIEKNPRWKVVAKKTFSGLLQGHLTLYYEDKEIFEVEQKNVLKHILMNLPFMRTFYFNPFLILHGGKNWGQIHRLHYGFSFIIKDDEFELRLHSDLVLSLMENNHQIAIFHRISDGQYAVDYSIQGANRLGVLLLCCAFFDENYLVNRGVALTNIIPKDLFSDRAEWLP